MKVKANTVFLTFDGRRQIVVKKGEVLEVSPTLAERIISERLGDLVDEPKEVKKEVKKPRTKKAVREK